MLFAWRSAQLAFVVRGGCGCPSLLFLDFCDPLNDFFNGSWWSSFISYLCSWLIESHRFSSFVCGKNCCRLSRIPCLVGEIIRLFSFQLSETTVFIGMRMFSSTFMRNLWNLCFVLLQRNWPSEVWICNLKIAIRRKYVSVFIRVVDYARRQIIMSSFFPLVFDHSISTKKLESLGLPTFAARFNFIYNYVSSKMISFWFFANGVLGFFWLIKSLNASFH